MTDSDLPGHLRAVAMEVAVGAARLVRDQRPSDLSVSSTKSSDVDVVTRMDLASEAHILESLSRLRPDDGVLGEEGGLRAGRSGLTWVVDPIDGTVNYLYRVSAYGVSVAVVQGQPDPDTWDVLAGCVVDPLHDVAYSAALGEGATVTRGALSRHPEPPVALPGPAEVPMAGALVGTGFGYVPRRRAAQARVLAGILPRIRDIRRLGSAALDLCAVAEGRLDAYYERGLHPWDLAAGALIAQEAGAVVSGLPGSPAGEEMVVAAAPGLHRSLSSALRTLNAASDD